ncbi:MAG: ATP-binding protein [Mangrovibacterium sp.]
MRIEPDQIMVYNLGGPDRSLRIEDFATGHLAPARYRNRRLGDFLKELDLTEDRATGIAAIIKIMRDNGSPDPLFETDEDRTWFRVTLPIHPHFLPVEDDLVNEPDGVENGVENDVEKRLSLILKLMKEGPSISKKNL